MTQSTRQTYRRYSRHGMSSTPTYSSWCAMLKRCRDPKHIAYPRYGGRGITVCARWQASFRNFLADMGERPSHRHSIERRKNDRSYTPGNCRWATPLEQMNNSSRNRFIRLGEERMTVAQWARRLGLRRSLICYRLDRGWSGREALTPARPYSGKRDQSGG